MARKEAALKKFMFVSDYDPAHYNWTPEELSALGDPKKTALILMKRLNKNNIKIKGMYAIQHRSEKKGYFWASNLHEKDSAFREYQEAIHTKQHIHVLIFFEDGYDVRRHIVGGTNRTLISALSPPRLCRIGTCRRLSAE